MFEDDHSAARGKRSTRGPDLFKHDSEPGNAHAHALIERITPKLKGGVSVPRTFEEYDVAVNEAILPVGATLTRLC